MFGIGKPYCLRPGKHEVVLSVVTWLGNLATTQAFEVCGTVAKSDCPDLVGKNTMVWVWCSYPSKIPMAAGMAVTLETVAKKKKSGGELFMTWLRRPG